MFLRRCQAEVYCSREVREALAADERTAELSIDITDKNGVNTLDGRSALDEARRAASEVAKGVLGVTEVINNLQLLEEDTPVAEEDDFQALDDDDVIPVLPTRSE